MLVLAFAQAAPAAGEGQVAASPIMSLMPILLIFVVFYFLLIKPQKKKQREHVEMLNAIKKNDEIVTSGGIYGTIVNIQDDIITLRIDDNARIKIQKGSISRLKKK